MPIQTRGFGIDVMPRYTPVDPTIVTLDPNRATQGVLSAFQIADTMQKMKAYKAIQDELEATRAARIAAQNAGNTRSATADTAAIPNIPVLAQLEGARAKSALDVLAPATEAEVAAQKARKGGAEIEIATQPSRLTTATTEAAGAADRAKEVEALKTAQLDLAKMAAEYAKELDPVKHQLIMSQAADQLTNAKTDADRKRALEQAKINLENAQAEQAKAHAAYFEGGGTSKDPVAQLAKFHTMESQVSNEQVKLLNTQVPNPSGDGTKISLAQYISQTREPSTGKIATERTGFLWQNKTQVKTNPEAEAMITQLQDLGNKRQKIQQMASSFFDKDIFGLGGPAPAQAAEVKVSTKEEYDKLPAGTEFVGPDGKKYVKK